MKAHNNAHYKIVVELKRLITHTHTNTHALVLPDNQKSSGIKTSGIYIATG